MRVTAANCPMLSGIGIELALHGLRAIIGSLPKLLNAGIGSHDSRPSCT